MTYTYAAVLATQEAWNTWGESTTQNKIGEYASYLSSHWNSDIEDSSGNYNLTTTAVGSDRPQISTPQSTEDGCKKVRVWLDNNTNLFSWYDSLIVLDSRNPPGGKGWGFIEQAGTNWGIGYVSGSGNKITAAHELGHNYGGRHADTKQEAHQYPFPTFESTWAEHSFLGNFADWDCNINQAYTAEGSWYASCTVERVRKYIDNKL